MTANRSLDEFAGGESGAASEPDDGPKPEDEEAERSTGVGDEPTEPDASGAGGARDAESATDPGGADVGAEDAGTDDVEDPDVDGAASVDPAGEGVTSGGDVASTYVWSPGGGACADCGASAEERWRGDDGLVCLDCKEW